MTDPCEGKYDIVSRLRDHTNRDDNDIAEAAAYIERLRIERDEAQRMVCIMKAQSVTYAFPPKHFAKRHGWPCFPEVTP